MIGIVGNGFVGNAVYQYFKDKVPVKVYDIMPDRCLNSIEEVLLADFIFICLPTPMMEDGRCNLHHINDFFKEVKVHDNRDPLFIIKSTVPIGTTDNIISLRPDLNIINSPEFLTALNSTSDFANSTRTIIGGDQSLCLKLKSFLSAYFDKDKILIVRAKEAETIKYFSNSFLALKVAFFNNLYDTCSTLSMDFESVRQGICSDNRIGHSHSRVPGSDGCRGFGGFCFPKDVNALIYTLEENKIDNSILSSILNYNYKIRNK